MPYYNSVNGKQILEKGEMIIMMKLKNALKTYLRNCGLGLAGATVMLSGNEDCAEALRSMQK